MMQDLTIDSGIRAMIPPLSCEERASLEENIIRDGCREPLTVWASTGILLDGHNRHDICTANGIPFSVVEVECEDRDAALDWIDRNQLGRRNLAPDAMSLLRGRVYNRAKKAIGRPGKRCQSDNIIPERTCEAVAEKLGVSISTINRDGAFAAAAESLGIQADIAAGDIPATRKEVVEAAESVASGADAEAAVEKLKTPHVARNTGVSEWYTPLAYVEAARKVMGDIDCDPATSEIANLTVKARNWFTKEQDGLRQIWDKRVWMNPPYSQPLCSEFCETLAAKVQAGEVEQACVLVNNATETDWFIRLIKVASAVVFTRGRVKFLDPDGKPGAPLQGQAIVYIGGNPERFLESFAQFGWGACCEFR